MGREGPGTLPVGSPALSPGRLPAVEFDLTFLSDTASPSALSPKPQGPKPPSQTTFPGPGLRFCTETVRGRSWVVTSMSITVQEPVGGPDRHLCTGPVFGEGPGWGGTAAQRPWQGARAGRSAWRWHLWPHSPSWTDRSSPAPPTCPADCGVSHHFQKLPGVSAPPLSTYAPDFGARLPPLLWCQSRLV